VVKLIEVVKLACHCGGECPNQPNQTERQLMENMVSNLEGTTDQTDDSARAYTLEAISLIENWLYADCDTCDECVEFSSHSCELCGNPSGSRHGVAEPNSSTVYSACEECLSKIVQ